MIGFLRSVVALAAMAVLLALAAGIAIGNTDPAVLGFWPTDGRISLPLWLVVLGSFVIGLVLGAVLMLAPVIRGKWRERGLKTKIRKMENAIEAADNDATPKIGKD